MSTDVLDARYVGSRELLDRLVQEIGTTVVAGGARFPLILGPSGAGKSHLLALLAHRLAHHPQTTEAVLLILDEDCHPASLVGLVTRLLAACPEVEGLPSPQTHVERVQGQPQDQQLDTAVALLTGRLGSQPVVLLIDQLDRHFEAIGVQGQSRLRGLLQDQGRWSLVGTSIAFSRPFRNVQAPFYRTFHRVNVPPLDLAQAHGLLVAHAPQLDALRSPQGIPVVHALRALLGSRPGAWALVAPHLTEDLDVSATLRALANDGAADLRSAILQLPVGQRPYMEHLVRSWVPLSAGVLASRTFATPQTASGQLRYLLRDGLVDAHAAGRFRYYQASQSIDRLAGLDPLETSPFEVAEVVRLVSHATRVRVLQSGPAPTTLSPPGAARRFVDWRARRRQPQDPDVPAANPQVARLLQAFAAGDLHHLDPPAFHAEVAADVAIEAVTHALLRDRAVLAAHQALTAVEAHPQDDTLRDLAVRALWAAGRPRDAALHAQWRTDHSPGSALAWRDRVGLAVALDQLQDVPQTLPDGCDAAWMDVAAARGDWDRAASLARRVAPRASATLNALRGKAITDLDPVLLTAFLRPIAALSSQPAIGQRLARFGTQGAPVGMVDAGLLLALATDTVADITRPGWPLVAAALWEAGLLYPRTQAMVLTVVGLPDIHGFVRLAPPERHLIQQLLGDSAAGRTLAKASGHA